MARKERREMLLASPLEALKKNFSLFFRSFPAKSFDKFQVGQLFFAFDHSNVKRNAL